MQVADVLIQAGHEGKNYGSGDYSPYGNETEWTPIVADEATRILRSHGLQVIRVAADLAHNYNVKNAVYLHFDSSAGECQSSGASVVYEGEKSDAAQMWKCLYGKYWPFKWVPDNSCSSLVEYYGFSKTFAVDAKLVLLLGDLTDEEQARWLQPRLLWIGRLVGYFLASRIGKQIKEPEPFIHSIISNYV